MDESSKSRRVETPEFWEEAIRLWAESGLPVGEFCSREGLRMPRGRETLLHRQHGPGETPR
jgi:hypothetical protein